MTQKISLYEQCSLVAGEFKNFSIFICTQLCFESVLFGSEVSLKVAGPVLSMQVVMPKRYKISLGDKPCKLLQVSLCSAPPNQIKISLSSWWHSFQTTSASCNEQPIVVPLCIHHNMYILHIWSYQNLCERVKVYGGESERKLFSGEIETIIYLITLMVTSFLLILSLCFASVVTVRNPSL